MTDLQKEKPKTINTELIYYMFDEIKAELRDIKKEYVTKAESAALKHEIEELRREVDAIKKQKNLWAWLSPTLSSAATAVFTFLVLEFLKRR